MDLKVCSKCGVAKSADLFYQRHGRPSRDSICSQCRLNYAKNRRQSNSETVRHNDRVNWIKKSYRMTIEEYDRLLTSQGGVCKICKCSPSDTRFAVDHDHSCCPGRKSCGKCIRGLLCGKCNKALGLWGDDPKLLAAAIEYLS